MGLEFPPAHLSPKLPELFIQLQLPLQKVLSAEPPLLFLKVCWGLVGPPGTQESGTALPPLSRQPQCPLGIDQVLWSSLC
jgi:hypothetical protein